MAPAQGGMEGWLLHQTAKCGPSSAPLLHVALDEFLSSLCLSFFSYEAKITGEALFSQADLLSSPLEFMLPFIPSVHSFTLAVTHFFIHS